MTPAQQQAVERLTRGIDSGPGGSGYPICKGCGVVWMPDEATPQGGHHRACPVEVLLSLVASPAPAVEVRGVATEVSSDGARVTVWIQSGREWTQGLLGQRVAITPGGK